MPSARMVSFSGFGLQALVPAPPAQVWGRVYAPYLEVNRPTFRAVFLGNFWKDGGGFPRRDLVPTGAAWGWRCPGRARGHEDGEEGPGEDGVRFAGNRGKQAHPAEQGQGSRPPSDKPAEDIGGPAPSREPLRLWVTLKPVLPDLPPPTNNRPLPLPAVPSPALALTPPWPPPRVLPAMRAGVSGPCLCWDSPGGP